VVACMYRRSRRPNIIALRSVTVAEVIQKANRDMVLKANCMLLFNPKICSEV